MKKKPVIYELEIEKIASAFSQDDKQAIYAYFQRLDERIKLPPVGRNILFSHFLKAFDCCLDSGKSLEETMKLLDPVHLGDFFLDDHRDFYTLDNAAIIYPLSLRYDQMPIFRLSAEMNSNVIPELLQIAVDFTLKRFPTFAAVIKNGVFWHYLETTSNIPIVEEEKDIPCKPISILLRSSHSFRVFYYRKRISVEFFHVLTDGSGGMVFLKTLIGEYLRLTGVKMANGQGVLDIDEVPRKEEHVNEFRYAQGKDDINTFVDSPSLQLGGKLSRISPCRIIHLTCDADKVHKTAKGYGGTVTAYYLSLMFLAAKKTIKKKSGIFKIQVPVNMRKYNGSKTLRNYSMYFSVAIDIKDIADRETLIQEITRQMQAKGDEKTMNQMMKTTGKLIRALSFVPLILKTPVVKLVYGYLGNNIIGSTLSNLGVIETPDAMKGYVDRFRFLLSIGKPNRASCTLATYNDKAVFTICKATRDTAFEDEIHALLIEDGLEVEAEGSTIYGA